MSPTQLVLTSRLPHSCAEQELQRLKHARAPVLQSKPQTSCRHYTLVVAPYMWGFLTCETAGKVFDPLKVHVNVWPP